MQTFTGEVFSAPLGLLPIPQGSVPEPHPLSILGQIGNTVTNIDTQLVLQRDQVPLREPAQKYRLSSRGFS